MKLTDLQAACNALVFEGELSAEFYVLEPDPPNGITGFTALMVKAERQIGDQIYGRKVLVHLTDPPEYAAFIVETVVGQLNDYIKNEVQA